MKNKLQMHFPMIRTRGEIMAIIEDSERLKRMFYHWTEEQRQEFLDFCTGVRGVKTMYDFISKEVLNPEYNPERVDELLSLLLKQKVRVVEVLPNDSTRIADETSLVIMDIVVQLKDGSIANLEIQKIGYKFPGGSGAHATLPTCCSGNIRESAASGRKSLFTKISNKYLQSYYSNRARRHFISFLTHTFTILNRDPIPGLR